MTIISFVNIGIVILVVNMNAGKHLKIPLLQGSYNTFTVDWYRVVGTNLCIQMALMIVTQHGANLMF